MSSNTQKLAVLRRRTDHDLTVLIQRELDRGLASVDVASTRSSPFFSEAMHAHSSAAALWAKVSGAERVELGSIDEKLKELRARLEDVPAAERFYTSIVA